jgi:hypothetical protein
VRSLLQAPWDVDRQTWYPSLEMHRAGSAHRALFESYVRELRSARTAAEEWWEAQIDQERTMRTRGDQDQAVLNVAERLPVGPISHGLVIGTVRRYWLACVAINSQVAPGERVAPQDFILRWLLEAGSTNLAVFLSRFPFWPMGMDPEGRWT